MPAKKTGSKIKFTPLRVSKREIESLPVRSPKRLFLENTGLAFSRAQKFFEPNQQVFVEAGLELDDVVQHAFFGLLDAAKAFDPSRGYRFSTLAVHVINKHLSRILKAARKEKSKKGVVESLFRQVTDRGLGRREVRLFETIADSRKIHPDAFLKNAEQREWLLRQINGLEVGQRNKDIFVFWTGLEDGVPKTLEFTGKRFGMTKSRIGQITAKILKELRKLKR